MAKLLHFVGAKIEQLLRDSCVALNLRGTHKLSVILCEYGGPRFVNFHHIVEFFGKKKKKWQFLHLEIHALKPFCLFYICKF